MKEANAWGLYGRFTCIKDKMHIHSMNNHICSQKTLQKVNAQKNICECIPVVESNAANFMARYFLGDCVNPELNIHESPSLTLNHSVQPIDLESYDVVHL